MWHVACAMRMHALPFPDFEPLLLYNHVHIPGAQECPQMLCAYFCAHCSNGLWGAWNRWCITFHVFADKKYQPKWARTIADSAQFMECVDMKFLNMQDSMLQFLAQNMFALITASPACGQMSVLVCELLALVCTTYMNNILVNYYSLVTVSKMYLDCHQSATWGQIGDTFLS